MRRRLGYDVGAVSASRLSDLVLRMGEEKIDATAVNVEHLAKVLFSHGRAFEMPAGPAITPWAFPAGVRAFAWFPKHEIHRIWLIGANLYEHPRAHCCVSAARETHEDCV